MRCPGSGGQRPSSALARRVIRRDEASAAGWVAAVATDMRRIIERWGGGPDLPRRRSATPGPWPGGRPARGASGSPSAPSPRRGIDGGRGARHRAAVAARVRRRPVRSAGCAVGGPHHQQGLRIARATQQELAISKAAGSRFAVASRVGQVSPALSGVESHWCPAPWPPPGAASRRYRAGWRVEQGVG